MSDQVTTTTPTAYDLARARYHEAAAALAEAIPVEIRRLLDEAGTPAARLLVTYEPSENIEALPAVAALDALDLGNLTAEPPDALVDAIEPLLTEHAELEGIGPSRPGAPSTPFDLPPSPAPDPDPDYARRCVALVDALAGPSPAAYTDRVLSEHPHDVSNLAETEANIEPARYLLAERAVSHYGGGFYFTFCDSLDDAAGVINGNEYPEDWVADEAAAFDLDTGDVWTCDATPRAVTWTRTEATP